MLRICQMIPRRHELLGPFNPATFAAITTARVFAAGRATIREVVIVIAPGTPVGVDEMLGELIRVVREGEPFVGSTIKSLSFNTSTVGGNGLNNHGQSAYGFLLADGRSGIAVATIPEPTSAVLFSFAAAALIVRKRKTDNRH